MSKRTDPFTVLVERDDEGYFVATVPELRGCHTQAKSLDMAKVQKEIRQQNNGSRKPEARE